MISHMTDCSILPPGQRGWSASTWTGRSQSRRPCRTGRHHRLRAAWLDNKMKMLFHKNHFLPEAVSNHVNISGATSHHILVSHTEVVLMTILTILRIWRNQFFHNDAESNAIIYPLMFTVPRALRVTFGATCWIICFIFTFSIVTTFRQFWTRLDENLMAGMTSCQGKEGKEEEAQHPG